jgi:hypothetical protein
MASLAPAAVAAMVEVKWNERGEFNHNTTVAPGKLAEVCVALAESEAVQWRFNATAPIDFNIHYHHGKDVTYPLKRDGVAADGREFKPRIKQDYCWMWSNRSDDAVKLQIELKTSRTRCLRGSSSISARVELVNDLRGRIASCCPIAKFEVGSSPLLGTEQ